MTIVRQWRPVDTYGLFLCVVWLCMVLLSNGGFVCVSTDDADNPGHCQGYKCGGLYPNLIRMALEQAPNDTSGILAVGSFYSGSSVKTSLEDWVAIARNPSPIITYASSPLTSYNLSQYKLLYIPSDIQTQLQSELVSMQHQIAQFVNVRGGSLISLSQAYKAQPYGFLPAPLSYTALEFIDVSITNEMQLYSTSSSNENLDHSFWHGYFTGPVDWNGLRVIAYQTGFCPVPSGPNQNCRATVLCNTRAVLTSENCYDLVDNDGNGLVDKADSACRRCGDGVVDPGEQCDDGNILDGDGCSATCTLQDLPPGPSPPPGPPYSPPPSPGPSPPPGPPYSPPPSPGPSLPPEPPLPTDANPPPMPPVPSLPGVDYNYLMATARFQGDSPYASCDTGSQASLVSVLARALNLPQKNVSMACAADAAAGGSTSTDTQQGRRLVADTECPAAKVRMNITFKVEPARPMASFREAVYDALSNSGLIGVCPLGPVDGNWATHGSIYQSGSRQAGASEPPPIDCSALTAAASANPAAAAAAEAAGCRTTAVLASGVLQDVPAPTPTGPPGGPSSARKASFPILAVIAAVVGCLLLCVLGLIFALLFRRRKKRKDHALLETEAVAAGNPAACAEPADTAPSANAGTTAQSGGGEIGINEVHTQSPVEYLSGGGSGMVTGGGGASGIPARPSALAGTAGASEVAAITSASGCVAPAAAGAYCSINESAPASTAENSSKAPLTAASAEVTGRQVSTTGVISAGTAGPQVDATFPLHAEVDGFGASVAAVTATPLDGFGASVAAVTATPLDGPGVGSAPIQAPGDRPGAAPGPRPAWGSMSPMTVHVPGTALRMSEAGVDTPGADLQAAEAQARQSTVQVPLDKGLGSPIWDEGMQRNDPSASSHAALLVRAGTNRSLAVQTLEASRELPKFELASSTAAAVPITHATPETSFPASATGGEARTLPTKADGATDAALTPRAMTPGASPRIGASGGSILEAATATPEQLPPRPGSSRRPSSSLRLLLPSSSKAAVHPTAPVAGDAAAGAAATASVTTGSVGSTASASMQAHVVTEALAGGPAGGLEMRPSSGAQKASRAQRSGSDDSAVDESDAAAAAAALVVARTRKVVLKQGESPMDDTNESDGENEEEGQGDEDETSTHKREALRRGATSSVTAGHPRARELLLAERRANSSSPITGVLGLGSPGQLSAGVQAEPAESTQEVQFMDSVRRQAFLDPQGSQAWETTQGGDETLEGSTTAVPGPKPAT